jgi:hypothetical protein|tara:strand:- start:1555 stop:2250 length:696 start_codon:yes stop_codon:yes gene_type:complete
MGLTYVQLKQAIQDFTENDATEFTTATGSGKAPIDLCIEFAEMRVFREADVAAYRKTVDVTLSANNQFLDLPQDLYVTRYVKVKTGEFLKEKDQSFVREFSQNDSAGVAALQGTPKFYALYGEGAYSASDRGMKWLFSPRADVDYTLEIGYTILPTGLSGSNANSYLGDYAPDLLLYACLLEAASFMKSPADQGSRYQALYDRALQTFIGQEQVKKRTDEFVSGETGTKGL